MFPHETLLGKLAEGDRTHVPGGSLLPREFLRSVLEFAARYAKLEELLFGGTRVAYSPSVLDMNLSLAGDLVLQGEALAEAERARFELPAGPILELGHLVEVQGIKVIPRVFPPVSPARGGFFFDSELGPCILLNAATSTAERAYVLAHEFGHFLADFEPYIKTVCGRPNPEMLEDPHELRAHQFALAFLMPRADVEEYRDAMGLVPGNPVPIDLVRQLAVYFDTDLEIVFWRMLSLGWLDGPRIETLLRDNPGLQDELRGTPGDPGRDLIPERYVHLVASAFGHKKIDLEDAAEYLGTHVAETQRLLDQFHYDDPDAPPRTPGDPHSAEIAPPEPSEPSPN
jgi:Zn-dependent peptidase ImmA (M78 family)